MELHLSIFMINLILFVGLTINYGHASASESASTTPLEMYWRSVLPDTPMPIAITNSLQSVGDHDKSSPFRVTKIHCNVNNNYHHAATRKDVEDHLNSYGESFMLEADMNPGRTMDLRWPYHADNKVTFLPYKVSDSIPFSSNKLPQLLNKFSVDPKSKEAAAMENSIKSCEEAYNKEGESKFCATSLETMVSFATSKLGNQVNPISSTVTRKSASIDTGMTKFRITGVKKLADYGSGTVVCHKKDYPYAVFYCHAVKMTAAYEVSLVGDGIGVKAAAVCHKDTSWFNPRYLAFQLLKVKPGKTMAICHFLEKSTVLWTQK